MLEPRTLIALEEGLKALLDTLGEIRGARWVPNLVPVSVPVLAVRDETGDPISGHDERKCDGGFIELWIAADGKDRQITLSIENAGDCHFKYKGAKGVANFDPGSKHSVTDITNRFAVECTKKDDKQQTGTCKVRYEGTVRNLTA